MQGAQGIQGTQGITGAQGAQGIQGTQGIKGDTGSVGIASTANQINISATNPTDTSTYLVLVGNNSTGGQEPFIDGTDLTYNSNTNVLSVPTLNATTGVTLGDGDYIYFGASNDLQASYDGTGNLFNIKFGSADINAVRILDNSDAEKLTFDKNGRLGIGSTVPSQSVDVIGTVKATTFSGSGANLSSGTVPIASLDIDGGSAIGSPLADADLFIVDDGGAGDNRKIAATGISSYVFGKVSGDVTINSSGTAAISANAVELGTDTTGNYVATISGTSGEIEVSGSGSENASVTVGLPDYVTIASGINVTSGIVTASQFHTGASGSAIRVSSGTISGPSEIVIDPSAVGDNTGAVRIKGDLYVDGTQTYINSTTIELADFNVGVATTVGTNSLLDGAGIGIGSTGIRKTITWNNTAQALTSNEDWNLASGKVYEIGGTTVLNSNTLGSGVVNSSLTSVGTLGQLIVTGVTTSNAGIANSTTLYGSATASASTTSAIGIHSGLSASTYRSVEYTIQASQGSNYHTTKILTVHNGTTSYNTEYATIYNNTSVATFDVDISGGNLRLLATGASASTTNYVVNFVATKI